MPLDGVTIKCLADELNTSLRDSRVDRISQPDRHDIAIQFYKNAHSDLLIISANPASPRIHLTKETRENPIEAPMFCMLLRKHLIGSRLKEIISLEYERVIQLKFDTFNEMGDPVHKTLLIELMGHRSNIILLNQDGRIHDSIVHVDASINRIREILPARPYVAPPCQNKMLPQAALSVLKESGSVFSPSVMNEPLEKALLASLQGFSPLLCQEIILLSGLEGREKPFKLGPEQTARLNCALVDLLEKIVQDRFSPSLYYHYAGSNLPVDFHALPLHQYAILKSVSSLSEAMDVFYLEKVRQNSLAQKKQHLSRIIDHKLDHIRKKLGIHEKDQREGSAYESYRRMGDLILTNIQDIHPDLGEATVVDNLSDEQPVVQIPLLPHLTASQNAQRYYSRYTKAKAKYAYAQRLIAEDIRDLAYLESLRQVLAAAFEPEDFLALNQEIAQAGLREKTPPPSGRLCDRKQKIKSKKGKTQALPVQPRRYISSDGLLILAGRNNLQNDQLTLKTAHKSDIWLHVQKMPGTHVIIQANRQPVPDQTLLEAAETAAWFSKASDSFAKKHDDASSLKIAVDYCPVSHVRKPAGARPGMVIYEHYQTIFVTPKEPRDLAESSL